MSHLIKISDCCSMFSCYRRTTDALTKKYENFKQDLASERKER